MVMFAFLLPEVASTMRLLATVVRQRLMAHRTALNTTLKSRHVTIGK